MSMATAIGAYVHDGDTVAIEGFTHLISFAAGHEVIRQRKRDLTLCRLTPDVVYDQLAGAGVARKLVFSWLGNPGVGSLYAIRRRIEAGTLETEEYSHFGMVGRYTAGASGLPFYPLRSYTGSDLPAVNPMLRTVASPYDGTPIHVVPPLTPDVTIIHAHRADADGNTQAWGLLGCQKEAAFAARRVIVVVEQVVDAAVIRSDPNRTLVPGLVVDAVVCCPRGAHPSYVQGHYDRDNRFYRDWNEISADPDRLARWLDEWVYGTADHAEYLAKLGTERFAALTPEPAPAGPVDYGRYR
jgi:glutaconate CoA-transferase subunit A